MESLAFRPWMDAKVLEGFPEFTLVRYIKVKTLPDYSMAREFMPNTQNRSGNGAFWQLFRHIKRNEIAIIAPVRLDYLCSGKNAKVT